MKAICWLNGKYVDIAKARISPLDRGFLFGEGLFETWRTYRGKPYAIDEHLERMASSARRLRIPFDPEEAWEQRSIQLMRRIGMAKSDGAVRMTITRGRGAIALDVDKTDEPTRLMVPRPLAATLAAAKRDGVAVHLVSMGSGVSEKQRQVKSLNYLPAILAVSEAHRRGCFEAIYYSDPAHSTEERTSKAQKNLPTTVLEGTTSNVFIVRRGVVATPPISAGLLPGVTRAKTLRLARRMGKVVEERFSVEDLMAADEIFITASTIEVVPVVRIGKRKVGNGRPGEVALAMQHAYRAEVARRLGLEMDELGV